MALFFHTPVTRTGRQVQSAGFWERFNEGVITVNDQDHEDFQTLSGLKNMGSRMLKRRITNYCSSNNIHEIPVTARAKAVTCLEARFRQMTSEIETSDTSVYLKAIFPGKISGTMTEEFCRHQDHFIHTMKNEILKENKHLNVLNTDSSRTADETIRKLAGQKLRKAEDTRQMKVLVIQLYYYYLARYQDYISTCVRTITPAQTRQKTMKSSDTKEVRKSEGQIQSYLTSFADDMTQHRIVNYPESTYDLVVKCSRELAHIKSEVGVNHTTYGQSLGSMIQLATRTIFEMMENPVCEVLLAPITGLKAGTNLIEECSAVFDVINEIEMDNENLNGFRARKGYFELLKTQVLSHGTC